MNPESPRLSDADARVLDALMEEGFDASCLHEMKGDDRARAEELVRLLGELDRLPTSAPDPQRIPSLMARIDTEERAQRERLRLRPVVRQPRRLRVPDIITIAAVMLLAIGVGWPLASTIRSATLREGCERNLAQVHGGLDRYASDHAGRYPLTAGFAAFLQQSPSSDAREERASEPVVTNAPTARVDWRRHRHGENLELLSDGAYVGAHSLTCPACAKANGALALRVPAAGQRFSRTGVTGMLVADANPAIDLLCEGEPWRVGAALSSLNHRSRGQNILFDDGSVRWLISPVLPNGDSIWVPRDGTDASALENGGLPLDATDVFLAQ